jgi:hypothetical protein
MENNDLFWFCNWKLYDWGLITICCWIVIPYIFFPCLLSSLHLIKLIICVQTNTEQCSSCAIDNLICMLIYLRPPFHTKTHRRFIKVQIEHMHLALVETGEHIFVTYRAAGVCIKPGEDALPVVRMVASPETHSCALWQRVHAYAALAVLRHGQVPTVLARRHVDDEPTVHPKVEVKLGPIDPDRCLIPEQVQDVVRHNDVPLLSRELQVKEICPRGK